MNFLMPSHGKRDHSGAHKMILPSARHLEEGREMTESEPPRLENYMIADYCNPIVSKFCLSVIF